MYDIGFVGFGEANRCLLSGILKECSPKVIAYDVRNSVVKELWSRESGFEVSFTDDVFKLLSKTNVVFSALPESAAGRFMDSIKAKLTPKHIYVDFSTASPELKSRFNNELVNVGAKYVDVAMMGSLPLMLNKVPMLYCGSGSDRFADLCDLYGFNAKKIQGDAGTAAVAKLCRSVFMKGLAGLLIETKEIAEKYGISEEVFSSICESMDKVSFQEHIDRLIKGTYTHIFRRSHEISTAYGIFHHDQLPCHITESVVRVYRDIEECTKKGE